MRLVPVVLLISNWKNLGPSKKMNTGCGGLYECGHWFDSVYVGSDFSSIAGAGQPHQGRQRVQECQLQICGRVFQTSTRPGPKPRRGGSLSGYSLRPTIRARLSVAREPGIC